jgi:hypothetical protein
MKRVKIALLFECECGHRQPLDFYDHKTVHFVAGYTNESGTAWPSELEITCPVCGGTDDTTF